MRKKALLLCLLILSATSVRFDFLGIKDADNAEDPENSVITEINAKLIKEAPVPALTGITPEEKAKLESFIGSPINEESVDYPKLVPSKLTLRQISTFPEDIHRIASKVTLQFLHNNLNNGQVIMDYVKAPRCKIMTENIKGQQPWKFDHNALIKVEKMFTDFNEIYSNWFNDSSRTVRYRLYSTELLTEINIKRIRKHILKRQKDFIEFQEKFEAEIIPIMEDYRNGFCNMKNFLHYFHLLPRFYEAYKKVPEGFVKNLRFQDAGYLMARSRDRFRVIFSRIALLDLILQVISNYYFYLNMPEDFEADKVSLPLYQDAMLDIIEIVAEGIKGISYFKYRFEKYYNELKFIIYSLEDAAEIKSAPFAKLKFISGGFRLVAGLLALVVTLFFV